jgi:hypothetical protein
MKIKVNLLVKDGVTEADLGSLETIIEIPIDNVVSMRPYIDEDRNKTAQTYMEFYSVGGDLTSVVIDAPFKEFYTWWLTQTRELEDLKVFKKIKE